MNRRTRPTIPHNHFHKYLKPGALARIRDSRISARSHRLNSLSLSLSQIPLHRASPPPSNAAQPQISAIAGDGFPFFAGRIYGPRCLQRKKLMAAKSVLFLPVNPATDSPDLMTDSFGSDILVAN